MFLGSAQRLEDIAVLRWYIALHRLLATEKTACEGQLGTTDPGLASTNGHKPIQAKRQGMIKTPKLGVVSRGPG